MKDWNPDLYMKFKSERIQPSIDLIARIDQMEPKTIIDIGCGPGNSTQALVNRWPSAQVFGLDSSMAMINKARQDYPAQEWITADILTHESERRYNIVFSNAVIQWVPNHPQLLEKFNGMLSKNGLVAVQIPLFWDMPLGDAIKNTAAHVHWQTPMEGISDLLTIHDYHFYYDHLISLFDGIEMWETHYLHILDHHESILEMMRSTGLKPYLERLASQADKAAFEQEVLERIRQAYPIQKNGKVLLPFKRLFFIGRKQ